jgi:hypothetical protein
MTIILQTPPTMRNQNFGKNTKPIIRILQMKHIMPNPFSIYQETHLKPTWSQIQPLLKKNVGPNDPQIKNPNNTNDTWTNKFPYLMQNNCRKFTLLGQSYKSALKELLTKNRITLPDT